MKRFLRFLFGMDGQTTDDDHVTSFNEEQAKEEDV